MNLQVPMDGWVMENFYFEAYFGDFKVKFWPFSKFSSKFDLKIPKTGLIIRIFQNPSIGTSRFIESCCEPKIGPIGAPGV